MNVLITREKEKYAAFAAKLEKVGLTPFSLPMIECVPVPAIISGSYDYGVFFTSPNAAKFFLNLMLKGSVSRRSFLSVRQRQRLFWISD